MSVALELSKPEDQSEVYTELIIVDGKAVRATKQNSRNRHCRECSCICYHCPAQHTCCTMTVCCGDK